MVRRVSHMTYNLKRLVRNEQGIEIVEFLGFFAVVLLIVAIAWQFFLVGYTGFVTAGSAREGARAAVTMENVGGAVAWGSPGFDGRRWWTIQGGYPCAPYAGNPINSNVQLEVPHVKFPFLGGLRSYPRVTAVATMRCEPPFDAP